MRRIELDGRRMDTRAAAWAYLRQELSLPEYFGNNLDALWDSLTADIALPATIQFTNLTLFHLKKFEKLITLFEDAETELNGELKFSYTVSNDDKDIG